MTANVVTIGEKVTAPIGAKIIEPEFCDAGGLKALFGIRRSLAYTLLGEGRIRGISLRRAGNARGKRLFVVQSVRDFLNAQLQQAEKIADMPRRGDTEKAAGKTQEALPRRGRARPRKGAAA
jgi:hypothetical protein